MESFIFSSHYLQLPSALFVLLGSRFLRHLGSILYLSSHFQFIEIHPVSTLITYVIQNLPSPHHRSDFWLKGLWARKRCGLPFCSLSPFHLEESGMKGGVGTTTTSLCWLLLVLLLNEWAVNTLFVSGLQRLIRSWNIYVTARTFLLHKSLFVVWPWPNLVQPPSAWPWQPALAGRDRSLGRQIFRVCTSGQMPLSTRPREPLKYLFRRI